MQSEITKISQWFKQNHLKLNETKTQYSICGSRNNLRRIKSADHSIIINNHKISPSQNAKYLGITIDNTIKWTNHIKSLSTKISQTLGRIRSFSYFLPFKIKKMVYNALLLPHFNYCSTIWSSTSESNLNLLQKLLNRACRSALQIKDLRTNTLLLHKRLQWLPIKQLLKFNTACEMYKCINNITNYNITFPPLVNNVHHYPTRNNSSFFIPQTTSHLPTTAFNIKGPTLWNSLSNELKNSPTLPIFKRSYKKLLFTELNE